MSIRVDLSAVRAMHAKCIAELRSVPRIMQGAVGLAAAYERSTHRYQNRTYRLERSTVGQGVRYSRAEATVQLVMGMDYAVYVRARGLSNIDDAARRADEAMRDAFETFAR